jgi:hypothetical protein
MNKNLSRSSGATIFRKIFYGTLIITTLLLALSIKNIYQATYPNGLALSKELERYESPSGKYSMLISSKWIVFDLPHGSHGDNEIVTAISSPFSSISITVARKLFDKNQKSINEVVFWGKSKAQKSKLGYYEIQNFSIEGNNVGMIFEYTKDISSPIDKIEWRSNNLHCYDAYLFEISYGYRFSYCSVEKIWPEAKNVFINLIKNIELYE